MIRVLILLALASVVPAPSAAQAPLVGRSEDYQRCMASGDAARGNGTAIDICVGIEMVLQDERLDRAYRRAMAPLGWPTKIRLLALQRQWVADSTDRCARIAGLDPRASLTGSIYNGCILDETIARAAWLETYSPE